MKNKLTAKQTGIVVAVSAAVGVSLINLSTSTTHSDIHPDPELPKQERTIVVKEEVKKEDKHINSLSDAEIRLMVQTGSPIVENLSLGVKFGTAEVVKFKSTRYEISDYQGAAWIVDGDTYKILSDASAIFGLTSDGKKIKLTPKGSNGHKGVFTSLN